MMRCTKCIAAIQLEDISAPRCFEIEERLQAMLDIPVLHDDQHGTAVVSTAALKVAVAVNTPNPRADTMARISCSR